MDQEKFNEFLKIRTTYKLKHIARNNSNFYFDDKENIEYKRKETTAEHIYSCLKLADYFLSKEKEFEGLNRLKVYELLMYHDDCEIITGDVCVSETDKRENKKQEELEAIKTLKDIYPKILENKFELLNLEYINKTSDEAKFAKAIDKMDALIHELDYIGDWAKKGFTKEVIENCFFSSFEYSKTFINYYFNILKFLEINGYFNL